MKNMQAIILKGFGGVENFQMETVALPLVKENSLLICIKAVSFNPIDFQIRQGLSESKLLNSPILGREFSGQVVGGDFEKFGFKEGESVYGYSGSSGSNGTYAEYISLPGTMVSKMPSAITYEEAAAIPLAGLTALQCRDRLNIQKGASVFISGGAGGVGNFLLKLLRSDSVQRIYTTAGNENSRQAVKEIGLADFQIIDYRNIDYIQQLRDRNGSPFDYCIDLVGGSLSEVCAELLAVHGSYADVTFQGTPASREILFDKGITVYNISNYAMMLTPQTDSFATYGQNLNRLTTFIEEGMISPPSIFVVGTLSAQTVRTAHTLLESNQSKGKKLVMQIP